MRQHEHTWRTCFAPEEQHVYSFLLRDKMASVGVRCTSTLDMSLLTERTISSSPKL